MLSYSCRGISVICSEQPHLPQQRAALGVSEAVSVLVVASAVVVAVQDEKAEKERQCITTFSILQEGVGRSRPTATTIVILNRRQLLSGLKSLQF